LLLVFVSCKEDVLLYSPDLDRDDVSSFFEEDAEVDSLISFIQVHILYDTSEFEKNLIAKGLINVQEMNPKILVDLKYASDDNFLGGNVYGTISRCYLQPDVAIKLAEAQSRLSELKPGYRLLVYDCVRPRSVQYKMWDILEMPDHEKGKFVSNPKYGSLHNFGAAVDLTIVDENGEALDMGTPFDYIGELAYPTKEQELLKSGELTQEQVDNRKLLRSVMSYGGFFNIQTEWWHFNSCYRKEAYHEVPNS
jgi:zinc D-Ala-D-Ala dipeptidase